MRRTEPLGPESVDSSERKDPMKEMIDRVLEGSLPVEVVLPPAPHETEDLARMVGLTCVDNLVFSLSSDDNSRGRPEALADEEEISGFTLACLLAGL